MSSASMKKQIMKLFVAIFSLSQFAINTVVVDANHRGGSVTIRGQASAPGKDISPKEILHCCSAKDCELCDITNDENADIASCFAQSPSASMRVRYDTIGSEISYGACFNAIE